MPTDGGPNWGNIMGRLKDFRIANRDVLEGPERDELDTIIFDLEDFHIAALAGFQGIKRQIGTLAEGLKAAGFDVPTREGERK